MDNLTHEQRSKIMQTIRSENTGIELALEKALWASGLRYRKDVTTVFCDIEFWHGKEWELKKLKLKSNHEFWNTRLNETFNETKEYIKS